MENTYYRHNNHVATIGSGSRDKTISGVVLRNLEVCGSGQNGISAGSYKDVVVENCIVHSNAGSGIAFRNGEDLTVRNCLVMTSKNGVAIGATRCALIEGNEICHNRTDGLSMAGSGNPAVELPTDDVTVRRNYIHHHIYLSHPDNIQTFRGVTNLKIHDNFLAFAGQSVMVEDTSESEMVNNTSVCSWGWQVVFRDPRETRWMVKNNTVGFGGMGAFNIQGKGGQLLQQCFHQQFA